jgi:hypothetical protein
VSVIGECTSFDYGNLRICELEAMRGVVGSCRSVSVDAIKASPLASKAMSSARMCSLGGVPSVSWAILTVLIRIMMQRMGEVFGMESRQYAERSAVNPVSLS